MKVEYVQAVQEVSSQHQLFQGNLIAAKSMIPEKMQGDHGLEVCSIEDPSPTTPQSVATFTSQALKKQSQRIPPTSASRDLPAVPFIYLKKAQSEEQEDNTPAAHAAGLN